ncbi:MAG: bacillithiol biosynthesis cysteine-adding enzyme BshC [Flavobacteriales bacterium]|nr:bacillithiol biosynthesis cysteine-adding enzyme BshC [Flavobacteriales bacterium]
MEKVLLSEHQGHLSALWKNYSGLSLNEGNQLEQQIRSKIAGRKKFEHRELLSRVLLQQYGEQIRPEVKTNILRLKEENVFTVTTGHQICLLGGPSFSMYKILTTIRLAEQLNKVQSENYVVPVFWMATEDHDKEEIASLNLFGKELIWNTPQEGAVGRFSIDDLQDLLNELDALKGTLPHAAEVMELIRKSYSGNKSLAQATREWTDALFGKMGLVILDGDHPELKGLFSEIMREEIIHRPTLPLIERVNESLSKKGFEAQVSPRPINLFYLQSGSRKRIVVNENGSFSEYDGSKSWTESEIDAELRQHPENFSPNVLMRPLYQELILPNLAYVGGPGELSYWVQLPELFAHFKLQVPVMFPRNSVMLLDGGTRNRMEKLKIKADQLFLSADQIIASFLNEQSEVELDFSLEKNEIEKVFHSLAEKAAQADATLRPVVLSELQKTQKSIESIEGRIRKAEKQKHDQSIQQIRTLKDKLFPENVPQERVESYLPFLWKNGLSAISEVAQSIDPTDLHYHILFTA